jgi:hypothetical protein
MRLRIAQVVSIDTVHNPIAHEKATTLMKTRGRVPLNEGWTFASHRSMKVSLSHAFPTVIATPTIKPTNAPDQVLVVTPAPKLPPRGPMTATTYARPAIGQGIASG